MIKSLNVCSRKTVVSYRELVKHDKGLKVYNLEEIVLNVILQVKVL